MHGGSGTALKVGLSAALLVLGLLVAMQLPSASLAGAPTPTTTAFVPGVLVVSVTLNNNSGISPILGGVNSPMQGVGVGVVQLTAFGIHLQFTTNQSGVAESPLPQGEYGVSVGDSEFSLSTSVQVDSGLVTRVQVGVNRTAYYGFFAEADDSTTRGSIEPWNNLVVGVSTSGYALFVSGGTQIAVSYFPGQTQPPPVAFGPTVFLQPEGFLPIGGSGSVGTGAEVPATVVSQVPEAGTTWLTLQPARELQLAGAAYLAVVSYKVGSSVTIGNG